MITIELEFGDVPPAWTCRVLDRLMDDLHRLRKGRGVLTSAAAPEIVEVICELK